MAAFFTVVLLLLPILMLWWLISPRYYPFSQSLSRLKVILHSVLAFVVLLIALVLTIPLADQPINDATAILGFLLAVVAFIILAALSIKTKKAKPPVQPKTNKPWTAKPQIKPTKEAKEHRPTTAITAPIPQAELAPMSASAAPPTKNPEPKTQEKQVCCPDISQSNNDRNLDTSPPNTDKPSKDIPPIGSIQQALYEMDRKQVEEERSKLEQKSAAERLLAISESARQALKAINEKKKAESRTTHHNDWVDNWNDEWSDEYDDDYQKREQCEIHYTDLDGNFSIRDVEPINVRENSKGATILVAVDVAINEFRYFHLDRIELVSYDGNDYTKPKDVARILRKLSPECD